MIRASKSLAISALLVSSALHLSGVSLFWSSENVEIEGGAPETIARLGNSFQDVAQGVQSATPPDEIMDEAGPDTTPETVEPEEITKAQDPPQESRPEKVITTEHPVTPDSVAKTAEPRPKPDQPQPETLTAATPPLKAPSVPAEPLDQPVLDTAALPVPTETPILQTEAPSPMVLQDTGTLPAIKATTAAPLQVDKMAALAPVKTTPQITQPSKPVPVQPVAQPIKPTPVPQKLEALPKPEETVIQVSPRPKLRPKALERPVEKPKPRPKSKPKKKAKASQGANQPNQLRGSDDGKKTAKNTETSKKSAGKTKKAGNAAASNYKGKVWRKLSRLRRPNVNAPGKKVAISITIAANGSLAKVGIARSSGHSGLDQAALKMVRRAGKFPPPPPGAQRRFTFNVESR